MALSLQPSPQTLSPRPPAAHRSPSRAEPTLTGLTHRWDRVDQKRAASRLPAVASTSSRSESRHLGRPTTSCLLPLLSEALRAASWCFRGVGRSHGPSAPACALRRRHKLPTCAFGRRLMVQALGEFCALAVAESAKRLVGRDA